jgi:hypothetical protein
MRILHPWNGHVYACKVKKDFILKNSTSRRFKLLKLGIKERWVFVSSCSIKLFLPCLSLIKLEKGGYNRVEFFFLIIAEIVKRLNVAK